MWRRSLHPYLWGWGQVDSWTRDPGLQSHSTGIARCTLGQRKRPRNYTGSPNNSRSCRFYFLNDPRCATFCPRPGPDPHHLSLHRATVNGLQLLRDLHPPTPSSFSTQQPKGTLQNLTQHSPVQTPPTPHWIKPNPEWPPPAPSCSKSVGPTSLSSSTVSPTSSSASYPSPAWAGS